MATKKQDYGNDSISALKGADRVRKRPGVIFGSDGIEGCQHSIFEILSNSIDEAREGFGHVINVTHFLDGSIEVQDFGRGMPVDYNQMAGSYDISATVNGQTVTETVQVYGRQRRELDTYTIDGTSAIPYVGALPGNMDFLWGINDPDIYWDGPFIQPVQGKILRDYAVLEYTDRLDPTDPLNAAIPLDQIAAYNANIAPRRSINVTMATTTGSPVVAPAAGRVVYAQTNGSLGRVVVIEHGCGVKSLFYLLGRRDVDEGDFVTQGQQIGTTQGHVICEMRVGDIPVNPWDAWRGAGGLFF